MNSLHLFLPENDLALAMGGDGNYTPPPAAASLQLAGEALPMWYSRLEDSHADSSWATQGVPQAWVDAHPGLPLPATVRQMQSGDVRCRPWGWSRYARRIFTDLGVPSAVLPSDEALDRWRQASGRRSSALLWQQLRPQVPPPIVAVTLSQAMEVYPGGAVVKMPWSSSGRGVFRREEMKEPVLAAWLKRYGYVMVEPWHRIKGEFALLLYHAPGQGTKAIGWSMFQTEPSGSYVGNIVESQEAIIETLPLPGTKRLELEQDIPLAIDRILGPLIHDYEGWMGVDMYLSDLGLNPVSELNLRATMGVVAMGAASHGLRGVLKVKDTKAVGERDVLLSPPARGKAFVVEPAN